MFVGQWYVQHAVTAVTRAISLCQFLVGSAVGMAICMPVSLWLLRKRLHRAVLERVVGPGFEEGLEDGVWPLEVVVDDVHQEIVVHHMSDELASW